MRIAFLGASRFGLRCLELIASLPEVTVAAVVTAPEVFAISYRPSGVRNILHADFAPLAGALRTPLFKLRSGMNDPALHAFLLDADVALIVVCGWYHIIPGTLLERIPCIGLHASLLPDYRGGAPLVWAIINGESETGITLFRFDSGVDTGTVIAQQRVSIDYHDTIATVYERVQDAGLRLVAEALPRISAQGLSPLSATGSGGSRFPQRSPEDGRIDWLWSARRIYDFIRAQTHPYPGAFTQLGAQRLVVWQAREACQSAGAPSLEPGLALLCPHGEILVGTGDRGVLAFDREDCTLESGDATLVPDAAGPRMLGFGGGT